MLEIALQLYTVRSHTARNMLPTLRSLAAMGYRVVELAGYGNATPREIRTALDELGMHAIGAHVPLDSLAEHPQQILTDMQILGCRYVVIPWVPESKRSTITQVQNLAEEFNHFAMLLHDEGMEFAYHNHAFEFTRLGHTTIWNLLAEQTDPDLVRFELDIYWARYAGVEPLDLLEQHRERIPLLHLKDMTADHTRADVPIGLGTVPWKQLLIACNEGSERWLIIEQDHPRSALENVQTSLLNLQEMLLRI